MNGHILDEVTAKNEPDKSEEQTSISLLESCDSIRTDDLQFTIEGYNSIDSDQVPNI